MLNEEKETIILFNESSKNKICEVYTHNKKLINKMDNLCLSHNTLFKCISKDSKSKTYICPRKFIKVLKPRFNACSETKNRELLGDEGIDEFNAK